MIAIWPVGPPKEIKPSLIQKRKASLKVGCARRVSSCLTRVAISVFAKICRGCRNKESHATGSRPRRYVETVGDQEGQITAKAIPVDAENPRVLPHRSLSLDFPIQRTSMKLSSTLDTSLTFLLPLPERSCAGEVSDFRYRFHARSLRPVACLTDRRFFDQGARIPRSQEAAQWLGVPIELLAAKSVGGGDDSNRTTQT